MQGNAERRSERLSVGTSLFTKDSGAGVQRAGPAASPDPVTGGRAASVYTVCGEYSGDQLRGTSKFPRSYHYL